MLLKKDLKIVEKVVQPSKPDWVTEQVTDAINEKNIILYKRAQMSGLNEDWMNFRMKKKSTTKFFKETKCSINTWSTSEKQG